MKLHPLQRVIVIIFFLFSLLKANTQVSSVNYLMKYNGETCLYDCYFIINLGEASSSIASNAQYSIVVEKGDSIMVAQSYWPKTVNNESAEWIISSKIKHPAAQPQNDFWSIVPSLNTTSYYPTDMQPGDTIKLFSLQKIGNSTKCGQDIRIFINGVDPSSSEPGMQGSDFTNGFAMGNTTQIYSGNSSQVTGEKPKITAIENECKNGIEIALSASTSVCQSPLTYLWTGPAGYSGTSENVNIPNVSYANNGLYKVVITDIIGCKDSISINGISKPNAGPDITICAGLFDTIYGYPAIVTSDPPLHGSWSPVSGNPLGATLTNLSDNTVRVDFSNSAFGSYRYKYVLGSCSDTLRFTVNPKPSVLMMETEGCEGIPLNILSPTSGGTWTSSNPLVATVSNSGIIKGLKPGSCAFNFTRTLTGCSNTTPIFTFKEKPHISAVDTNLYLGDKTTLTSSTEGNWTALFPDIATVSETGIVTSHAVGSASFVFTGINGCQSQPFNVKVLPRIYQISGFCFSDFNNNNIYDEEQDFPLPNCVITLTGNNNTYFSDENGYFNTTVDSGAVQATYAINFGSWVQNSISRTLNISKPLTYEFIGFKPVQGQTTALVNMASPTLTCNKNADLDVQVFNNNSSLLSAYLVLTYDEKTYLTETNPLPSGGQDNMLIWAFNDLPPGKVFSPNIKYHVPSTPQAGDSLIFNALILDKNSNDSLSSFILGLPLDCFSSSNRSNSWPDRVGDDNYLLKDELIHYTINFQNTSSNTAKNVRISNILDPNLDHSSILIKEANRSLRSYLNGDTLVFELEKINLPGQNTDAVLSQGVVSFSVAPKKDVADKTVISNFAKIEMDNGLFFITNTSVNTLVSKLPCDLVNDEITQNNNGLSVSTVNGNIYTWYDCKNGNILQQGFYSSFNPSVNGSYYAQIDGHNCLTTTSCFNYIKTANSEVNNGSVEFFPNPFDKQLIVKCNKNILGIQLFDFKGKKVASSENEILDTSLLPSGLYFLEIKMESGSYVFKVVKQ